MRGADLQASAPKASVPKVMDLILSWPPPGRQPTAQEGSSPRRLELSCASAKLVRAAANGGYMLDRANTESKENAGIVRGRDCLT